MRGKSLVMDGITHRYGSAAAVDNVSLDIAGGEMVALLGPSGCGKTTLLRIIAGFIAQTQGRIIVGDDVIDALPPQSRNVGIVFQNYALFPHMNVTENIAYGLAARGIGRADQAARVKEILDLIKLGSMGDRYPRELSGGQQQRIALGRALAVKPSILLLDEPFAALDKNLRLDMQIEIKSIQRQAGTTTILVTHDQEEALSMADRVAVLNQGRLEQFAPATDIYDKPASFFVNTFVGSANVLRGKVIAVSGPEARLALTGGASLVCEAIPGLDAGANVNICVRPEHLAFTKGPDGLGGTVEIGMPLGSIVIHEIRLASGEALKISEARSRGAQPLPPGTPVMIAPTAPGAVRLYPA